MNNLSIAPICNRSFAESVNFLKKSMKKFWCFIICSYICTVKFEFTPFIINLLLTN